MVAPKLLEIRFPFYNAEQHSLNPREWKISLNMGVGVIGIFHVLNYLLLNTFVLYGKLENLMFLKYSIIVANLQRDCQK